jgi:hypothetical protein
VRFNFSDEGTCVYAADSSVSHAFEVGIFPRRSNWKVINQNAVRISDSDGSNPSTRIRVLGHF